MKAYFQEKPPVQTEYDVHLVMSQSEAKHLRDILSKTNTGECYQTLVNLLGKP